MILKLKGREKNYSTKMMLQIPMRMKMIKMIAWKGRMTLREIKKMKTMTKTKELLIIRFRITRG